MIALKKISLRRELLLSLLLALMLGALAFSLFANLSHPLLWNDESYGAMNAERILTFGYPKVHDRNGVNAVYEPPFESNWLAFFNSRFDVSTYLPWGNDYLSVPGVFLAHLTGDMYLKTACVRLPFALFGILSLLLFVYSCKPYFSSASAFLIFSILFFLLELFAVSLVLHLREARYYSFAILLTSCFFYVFFRYFVFETMGPKKFSILALSIFFAAYHVNYVLLAVLYCMLLVWSALRVAIDVYDRKPFRSLPPTLLKSLNPLLISLVLLLPFELFFKTLSTAQKLSSSVASPWAHQWGQVVYIAGYFIHHEFFVVGILIKMLFLIAWIRILRRPDAILPWRKEAVACGKASLAMNLFLLLYIGILSRSPLFLYTRAFITLQPVWVLSIVLEFVFLMRVLAKTRLYPVYVARALPFVTALLFVAESIPQIHHVREHLFELLNPYKGPLDFIIPCIKEIAGSRPDLTVAVDYESTSFMYYLEKRVLVGYTPIDLEKDRQCSPDVIVFRHPQGPHHAVLSEFLNKNRDAYVVLYFPVLNAYANNIPELYEASPLTHRFRTMYTGNRDLQAFMFVKKTLLKAPS